MYKVQRSMYSNFLHSLVNTSHTSSATCFLPIDHIASTKMSSTNTSNNPNPSPPSPSTSCSRTEAKKKFTSPLQGLFRTKKSPSPPATQQKNAPRSSLDSEVTLLDTKKSSKSKSEVRTTESESEIEIEIERKDRYSRRCGSGSGSGTRNRTAEVPTMAGWGLEVGWGLLARGAAEDLCIPTYGSVYAHTFVLGRATVGLTTTRSSYDNALSPSTSSSSSPSSAMRDLQEEKKDYKAPRPPMNFH
ncbi:hypothetical protein BCV69DRAFT_313933 [Microstroma glucosiphilum]|uniref:Uncharacterized protein n=1 Tax=Pseudomicrostroma glucosiphilum TaxID=1684307 RepID=A0A316U1L3_9BASI|nr:hypothetical protein BCV69DRAFT_313933 [Pseudomicrostroma glucosiphilum]PWN19177.1 hypothetical protein BCV69DRAFT_313933 [Pseudomicrostroma glucosiphilum]